MKLSLQHFETFLAVAECGSFTAAAKNLSLSKASISQTIRLMESALHVSLFIRTTRRITLTDEGKLLFAQCQRLRNELETARELVNGFNTSPTGTLRISCNPHFAESHLVTILEKYTALYPDVKIEILAEERMPDMLHEQIDIVFGVNWPAPEDVVAKKITTTRYVLCASPDYFQKFGIPEDIKSLEKHRYIPHYGRSIDNSVTNLKKPMPLTLNPRLSINSTQLMKKCALAGLGIVQLHDYVISKELNNGTLIEVLSEHLIEKIPLCIYYQKHRFVQPKIRQFVNLCEPF